MDGKAEAYYQSIMEHIPLPIVVLRAHDGIVQYTNQTRLLGMPLLPDVSFFDWLRPVCDAQSLELIRTRVAAVGAGQENPATSLEVSFRVETTHPRWYRLRLRKLSADDLLLTFEDISAEKYQEEQNQLLRDQLHVVFDESLDIIVLVDEYERILRINPVVELLLGYRPDELIGTPFSTMLRLSQRSDSDIFSSLADHGAVFTALPFMRKDGEPCYMELTATLVPWQGSQAVMITLRDVTHKEELQRELVRVRRAQERHEHERALVNARANMIFVIAHQFRTPLTGISMSAQILDRYKNRISPDKYQTHLSRILAHIDQMDNMINDMLEARQAFNHGLEFEPVPMSLGEFSQGVFEEIAAQNPDTHRFIFKDTTSADYAMIDPSLMKYIVDNLLTNAVKYSPDGGVVSMSLREEGNEYLMTVSDEGVGIPEDSYETIFELFQRGTNVGNIQGTGIGLGLVRVCVAQHGGTIDFVSRVGHGTTFNVRIPIVRPGGSSLNRQEDDR